MTSFTIMSWCDLICRIPIKFRFSQNQRWGSHSCPCGQQSNFTLIFAEKWWYPSYLKKSTKDMWQTYVKWPQLNEKKQHRFWRKLIKMYILQLINLNMIKTIEVFLQHKLMPLDLLCNDTPMVPIHLLVSVSWGLEPSWGIELRGHCYEDCVRDGSMRSGLVLYHRVPQNV